MSYKQPKQHKYKIYKYIPVTSVLISVFTILFILIQASNTPKIDQKQTMKVKIYFNPAEALFQPKLLPSDPLLLLGYEGCSTTEIEEMNKINNESEVIEVEKPKDDFTYYEKVPLKKETQRYIHEQAKTNNLSYELVLAVIKTESNFDPSVISYNGTSVGLMQINQYNTLDWLAKETGIQNVNPYNPRHSVKMGTWYLGYLKGYWLERGVSEKNASKAALISYHRGIGGSKKYIRNYGFNSKYTNKIINYKNQLEGDS